MDAGIPQVERQPVIGTESSAELPEMGDRDADRPLHVDADARHPRESDRIGERAELGDHVARRGIHTSMLRRPSGNIAR